MPGLMKNRSGQGTTEYIIIVALVAIAAIAVFTDFGQTIRAQVGGMARELAGLDAKSSIDTAKSAAKSAADEGKKVKGLDN